jgi:hypothetical protein
VVFGCMTTEKTCLLAVCCVQLFHLQRLATVCVKVKLSHFRLGQVFRALGGSGSQNV